ncbi:MAG: hypothetical protein QF394_05140 [Rhodospirillales bacterium]|jgi:hypothetical protein|nr:hypothetical protein [Rhodospirillales bacterium]|tara:strand:+ start:994 stop:1122 length:129 start_codon:yes stop_codon:yes gene_type:complete
MNEHVPAPSKGFWSLVVSVIVFLVPWLKKKKEKEAPNMYPFF